jgi:hypothetical protein
MKASSKLGLMAAIIGMTAAMFSRSKQPSYRDTSPHLRKRNGKYIFGGANVWDSQAVFIPRARKFKGYMRDNRNWGRKHKAA